MAQSCRDPNARVPSDASTWSDRRPSRGGGGAVFEHLDDFPTWLSTRLHQETYLRRLTSSALRGDRSSICSYACTTPPCRSGSITRSHGETRCRAAHFDRRTGSQASGLHLLGETRCCGGVLTPAGVGHAAWIESAWCDPKPAFADGCARVKSWGPWCAIWAHGIASRRRQRTRCRSARRRPRGGGRTPRPSAGMPRWVIRRGPQERPRQSNVEELCSP